jgi:ankyrin repeat protein
MNACEGGHYDVVQYLIAEGADINAHRTVSNNLYE